MEFAEHFLPAIHNLNKAQSQSISTRLSNNYNFDWINILYHMPDCFTTILLHFLIVIDNNYIQYNLQQNNGTNQYPIQYRIHLNRLFIVSRSNNFCSKIWDICFVFKICKLCIIVFQNKKISWLLETSSITINSGDAVVRIYKYQSTFIFFKIFDHLLQIL